MYCVHCGIKLPAEAKFCHQCGQALPKIETADVSSNSEVTVNENLTCEIIYQATGERWGIFPRDIGEFQARLVNPAGFQAGEQAEAVIATSAKIEIMSCSFNPDQKNKRHRKAFEDLLQKLLQSGWRQVDKEGAAWYNITFRKNCC